MVGSSTVMTLALFDFAIFMYLSIKYSVITKNVNLEIVVISLEDTALLDPVWKKRDTTRKSYPTT